MRYWEEDRPDWGAEDREFAAVWRQQPKWVVSRSLKSVGPNATLLQGDLEVAIRGLKARLAGGIAVAGTKLAGSLTGLGLIDEYRLRSTWPCSVRHCSVDTTPVSIGGTATTVRLNLRDPRFL